MANASQVTTYNPWATASPYLTDIMGQAQGLYNSQSPLYANPAPNFGFGQATGAVGNALGGTTMLGGMASQIGPIAGANISSQFANPFGTTGNLDATGAIGQALSGTPDYSAVNGALDAANTQQWNQFYNQVVPQLNQRASFLGNPSGAIKDLNSAITNIGQNQSLNAQQAYLGQYNLAKQQQQSAASLVANGGLQGQSNALGLGGLGGQLSQGTGAQSLTAAQLFPGISTLPQQNLADYGSIVGNAAGKYGAQTQTINPSSAQSLANILGGITAGSGLYNTLFPQNGGGAGNAIIGGLGKLLGFNSSPNYSGQDPAMFGGVINQSDPFANQGPSGNEQTYVSPGSSGIPNNPYEGNVDPGFGAPDNYYNPTPTYSDSVNNQDWLGGSFTSAGGQAATQTEPTASDIQSAGITPSFDAYQAQSPDSGSAAAASASSGSSIGSMLGTAGSVFGIANGLRSGTAAGDASAALGAARLANKAGVFGAPSSTVGGGLGAASGILGIYNGLQQGGVSGYAGATAGALGTGAGVASMAGEKALASTLGSAAGAIAAPLALYNFATNYQSGAGGSDALNGAEAGATIGSGFGPIGTVVGGVIGGAVGAISSAFGPGAKDPETVGVQKLIDTVGAHPDQASQITGAVGNPYIAMAGLFDRRESTLPMYQQYGRMGEQKFTTDMVGKINQAVANGTISKGSSADDIYNKVVDPWVSSMGSGWKNVGKTYTDTTQGLLKQMISQYTSGQYANNWVSVGGDNVFGNMPSFGGGAPAPFISRKPPKLTTQQISKAASAGGLGRIAA